MTTAAASTVSSTTTSSPGASALQGARWALDASHSHVAFSVRHLMISNVRGEFQKLSGEATYDPAKPEASRLTASIEVASINTREEKRDAHLRSADFFDAENHPAITFASKGVRRQGDGFEVTGDLTIRATTHEVKLTVDEVTPIQTDPWGNKRVGATARAKIRRSDFGMKWNAALEAGGVLVGDEISIQIEVELVLQK